MTERLVTARELGELLGLRPGTVLDQWEAGKLPGFKIGRAARFDAAEILALTRREARPLAAVPFDRSERGGAGEARRDTTVGRRLC
ncbi:MAG: helix-turn-helix domain-containing protein, partial [Gaiellaceae bacterium]